MRLIHDFVALRKAFSHITEHVPFQVTMAEVAAALFCTQRNARLLLTKMIEQGWMTFVPSRERKRKRLDDHVFTRE